MQDYRISQFHRDWWNEKVWWCGGLKRDTLMWIAVGFVLGALYVKFGPNMDWVFGLRKIR